MRTTTSTPLDPAEQPRPGAGGQLWQLDPAATLHVVGAAPPAGHQLGGRVVVVPAPKWLLRLNLSTHDLDLSPATIGAPGRVVYWFERSGRQQLAFLNALARMGAAIPPGMGAPAQYFIPSPTEGLSDMTTGEWLACLNERIPLPAEAPAQAAELMSLVAAGDTTVLLRRMPSMKALPRPLHQAVKWWAGQMIRHDRTGEPLIVHAFAELIARFPSHSPTELLRMLGRLHPLLDLETDELSWALGRARRLITPQSQGPIPGLGRVS